MINHAKCATRSNRVDVPAFLRKFWAAMDTPVALSCYLLYQYGEHDQLIRRTIDPLHYRDHTSFFTDYQCIKIVASYPHLSTAKGSARINGIKQFLESESQCRDTNNRLRRWHDYGFEPPSSDVLEIFRNLPKIMSSLLGDCPEIFDLSCAFGPGASFSVRGDTSAFMKLRSDIHGTFTNDSRLIRDLFLNYPGLFTDSVLSDARGSELTFVPKNAKTDRPICIEPVLNGFVQKGVGTFIRDRLKQAGCDLRDQGRNQFYASRACELNLATVDLKSASDTIAYMLVLHVLPEPWMDLLSKLRSPQYLADGNWYEFHKFSSMGNAYTFELESAIFLTVVRAVCNFLKLSTEHVCVFGDDIIMPREAYETFRRVCQFIGFTINEEKTFVEGPFFESCGRDWFHGFNVRPFFLKKGIKTLEERFHLVNGLMKIVDRYKDSNDAAISSRYSRLLSVFNWCVDYIPLHRRYRVPASFGDIGIHSGFDNAVHVRHRYWCGFTFYGLGHRLKGKKLDWSYKDASYASSVHSSEVDSWEVYYSSQITPGLNGYYTRLTPRVETKRKYFIPTGRWDV